MLLFYSMNHPTKYLFHFICDNILKYLNFKLTDYPIYIDPLIHNNVPIMYKCLEDYITNPDILSTPTVINNKIITIEEFVKIYYDVYSKLELSDY